MGITVVLQRGSDTTSVDCSPLLVSHIFVHVYACVYMHYAVYNEI